MALQAPTNPAPVSNPAPSFSPFPRLPLELRLYIWDYMVPEGIVDVHLSRHCTDILTRFTASRPGIVTLHISHESRSHALRRFVPAFCRPSVPRPASVPVSVYTYVDFACDIFRISPAALSLLARTELAQIRVLETRWDNLPMFQMLSGRCSMYCSTDPLAVCTRLERCILTVPFAFLRGVVICSDESAWAERVIARSPYMQGPTATRILGSTWDEKKELLEAEFWRIGHKRPAWTPPVVVIKFLGYDSQ